MLLWDVCRGIDAMRSCVCRCRLLSCVGRDETACSPHRTASLDIKIHRYDTLTLAHMSKRDPSKAVKLIDRLKDLQLQGHWAKAVALFDNHPIESRQWRWQSFHYAQLLTMLLHARQPAPVPRIWEAMKLRPEIAIDEEAANTALALVARLQSQPLMDDVRTVMEERKFEYKQRALKALDRHRSLDWATALAGLCERHAAGDGQLVPRLEEFNQIARQHRRNEDVVRLVLQAMTRCSVEPDGDTYGALIRAVSGDWQRAMATFTDAVGTGMRPTTQTYNGVLVALLRGGVMDRAEHVFKRMASERVPHDSTTVEMSMRRWEHTTQWEEATQYLTTMQSLGIAPNARAYSALVKTLREARKDDLVVAVVKAMRGSGVKSNMATDVNMINAWSRSRQQQLRRR